MSALQDLYRKGGLGYIGELIIRVGNYAWGEMTLLEQGELRENAAKELTASKQRIDKYYGIIQEVVKALAEDGRFEQTVVAIREELGSDLERYASLEWHLWAVEKPENEPVLIYFKDGTFQSFMKWPEFFGCDKVLKWAYLPTGLNKE